MTYNDLVAMLHAAKAELSVLASYAEDPTTQWPNLGLKKTAHAHTKLRDQIAALLATDPVEVSLREENLALRAALRSCQNNEDWRVKYVEAESARVKLQIRVGRLEWLAEAGCENTPTRGCECPGCMTARERAKRGEA